MALSVSILQNNLMNISKWINSHIKCLTSWRQFDLDWVCRGELLPASGVRQSVAGKRQWWLTNLCTLARRNRLTWPCSLLSQHPWRHTAFVRVFYPHDWAFLNSALFFQRDFSHGCGKDWRFSYHSYFLVMWVRAWFVAQLSFREMMSKRSF